ncbi:NUDIX hydrolase [Lichenifustis flavocetrariae]|uniref:NUDIX domain-containing protein n=1 Tax=Lichenifustis flavocetrariae TaxID=2949735 RepID=A0AA41YWH0_9HYPH|nr:NUDIX domain-containing protein [Lichenifustis flavocetrariae]MCW6508580.1 NUDIX domain-containing protein [Lichenifustis flavocetrariae]
MRPHRIVEASGVECDLIDVPWDFARERADDIERNWRARTAATPDLFNGRVLLLHDGDLQPGDDGRPVFRGHCFETEFKPFLAWRDLGFPPIGVRNCFAMAALESADGAFILGEMNTHTAPAGQIYFPSGTPDHKDLVGRRLDLEASARRELEEETGLRPEELAFADGFTLLISPTRLCCMKRILSPETADVLVARIHRWLAQDPKPELARMHIVREDADITSTMPAFMVAYLKYRFGTDED